MEQIWQPLVFDVHYRKDGVSVTGLTVTVDTYRNATALVTGAAATEIGSGFYTYTIPGASVSSAGVYRIVFKTAGDVDEPHQAAHRMVGADWVENLDESISAPKALTSDYDAAKNIAVDGSGQVIVGQITSGARVILSSDQPDYAPARAGDEMGLTSDTLVQLDTNQPYFTPSKAGDAMTLTSTAQADLLNALDNEMPGLKDLSNSGVASAVWAFSTRQLTGFGSLVADIASAVWGAGTRTLSAFGFTVNTNANATETAIATRTARVDAMIENSGGDRFTAKALEQAPTGSGGGGGDSVWTESEKDFVVGKLNVGSPEEKLIPVIAPPFVDQIYGQTLCMDGQGNIEPRARISFTLLNADGGSYNNAPFDVYANNDGILNALLVKGAMYRAYRGVAGRVVQVDFPTPDEGDTFDLPVILGNP